MWMENRTGKESFSPVKFVVRKGLSVASLRDEIYCQLIRMALKNPNRYSILPYFKSGYLLIHVNIHREWFQRIWEALLFCCVSFEPSEVFSKYLSAFLLENAKSK